MSEYPYAHGKADTHRADRSIQDSTAFLIPHLSADTQLLDVGCGTGKLTFDLAEHITALGGKASQVTGVDQSTEALSEAKAAASEKKMDITFQEADAFELPFPDNTFDVVFCNQVLHHVANPEAALKEFERVTKPGGLIANRDADFDSMHWYPPHPGLSRWRATFSVILASHDGNAAMGRQLPHIFHEAGLTDLMVSGSLRPYADQEKRAELANSWIERTSEPNYARHTAKVLGEDFPDAAITEDGQLLTEKLGTTTREALEQITEGWTQWRDTPGAAYFLPFAEVIARVK